MLDERTIVDVAPRQTSWWRRHPVAAIVLAFIATRAVLVVLAGNPLLYGPTHAKITGDVDLYAGYARQILRGWVPYRDVHIEYPPGSLPFFLLPRLTTHWIDYRTAYVAWMLALDALGLWGLVRLAKRWGSWWGPVAWVGLLTLLGPIAYVRLDLIPAVALVWAVERMANRRYLTAGVLFGLGAIVKVYPAFLLPIAVAATIGWARRKRMLTGFVLAAGLPVVAFLPWFGGLWQSVAGYHSSRRVQVESLWGALLMSAHQVGLSAHTIHEFGAFDVLSPATGLMKMASTLVSFALLGVVVVMSIRIARRGPGASARLAAVAPTASFGFLVLMTGTGKVFSPQYMVWLVGAAAIVVLWDRRDVRLVFGLLAPACLLTQVVFPFEYTSLLRGHLLGTALLVARDTLVLLLGFAISRRAWRRYLALASVEELDDEQQQHGADERDEDRPQIEVVNATRTNGAEDCPTDHRAEHANGDREQATAPFVARRSLGEDARDEPDDDPREQAHAGRP
jgi:hypothetical protein